MEQICVTGLQSKRKLSTGFYMQNKSYTLQASSTINPITSEPGSVTLNGLASEYILIIDDSNQICSAVVTGITRACAENSWSCRIVQSGTFGLLDVMPMNFSGWATSERTMVVYTANSCRNALPVLSLPHIQRLTIVCDIMMPNDTTVGLFGLLSELTRLEVPVNLLFASGEGQNRYYIQRLLQNHKGYFVEKGSEAWSMLPYALVQRHDMFNYQTIVRSDFDQGRTQPLPERVMPEPLLTFQPVANSTPAPASEPLVSYTPVETAREVRQTTHLSPRFKTSTGILSLLTFWKRRAS